MKPLPRVTLVLGGARSGKSRHAESLVKQLPPPWTYLATGQALDEEMAERIAHHRKDRGEGWVTLEAPLELAPAIEGVLPGRPVLVDCLTLWVSNLMMAERDVGSETDRLVEALSVCAGPVVLVSNEVGLGIVPDNAMARAFRDHAGRLNQAAAAVAERVVFVAAGLPLALKGAP